MEPVRAPLYDLVRRVNDLFRELAQWNTEEIEAGDEILTVLGRLRRPRTTPRPEYFAMAQSGGNARVSAGIVLITKWPSPSGSTMAEPTEIGHAFPVAAADVALTPGYKVYVKCTLTAKEFTSLAALPSDGSVSFAGGTVTGGVGGKGGTGGYGGGGGGGGQGGGGGGGGDDTGTGSAGEAGTPGEDAAGSTAGDGGAGNESEVQTGAGGEGADFGVNDGGQGGAGGTGGAGAAGEEGEDAPAYGETGGPTQVTIPAFTAYAKQKVKTKVWEVTAAEVVCIAATASSTSFIYVPIGDVEGTASAPVLIPRIAGGPITVPEPQVINTSA